MIIITLVWRNRDNINKKQNHNSVSKYEVFDMIGTVLSEIENEKGAMSMCFKPYSCELDYKEQNRSNQVLMPVSPLQLDFIVPYLENSLEFVQRFI